MFGYICGICLLDFIQHCCCVLGGIRLYEGTRVIKRRCNTTLPQQVERKNEGIKEKRGNKKEKNKKKRGEKRTRLDVELVYNWKVPW